MKGDFSWDVQMLEPSGKTETEPIELRASSAASSSSDVAS